MLQRHHLFRLIFSIFMPAFAFSAQAQWGQSERLDRDITGGNWRFGRDMAIDGQTMAISTESPPGVYIYEHNFGVWLEVEHLSTLPGITGFGNGNPPRVDVSGNTIVIGITQNVDTPGGPQPEPWVFVYERIAGFWQHTQILTVPGSVGSLDDVAISGNSIFMKGGQDPVLKIFGKPSLYASWVYESSYDNAVFLAAGAIRGSQENGMDISGDTALVGNLLFRKLSTGWIPDVALTPPDGTPVGGEQFGTASAIHEDTAVIGAPKATADNKEQAGKAFVYERANGNWSHVATLTAPRAKAFALFGRDVAVSGDAVVVGAPSETQGGTSQAGAAYVYQKQGEIWGNTAELIPSDRYNDNGRFGYVVDISGDSAAVSAIRWNTIGTECGSGKLCEIGAVYLYGCVVDTDGDGLCDDWEDSGIPYYDSTGNLQHYVLPDADKLKKDIYLEIDVMSGVPFNEEAIDLVDTAFFLAPVDNGAGITLHPLIDNREVPYKESWDDDFVDFDAAKALEFGTSTEHGNAPLLEAKAKAYRYCLWVNRFATRKVMGWAETPGNDFMVGFGGQKEEDRTVSTMAWAFMHELGHTLNLRHGGADDVQFKPNHVSVMNYSYPGMFKGQADDSIAPLDITVDNYSREATPPLDENMLYENTGISSSEYFNVVVPYSKGNGQGIWLAVLNGAPVDWDGDGLINTEESVEANINNPLRNDPTLGTLESVNEWDLLILGLGGDGDYLDARHTNIPETEISVDLVEYIHSSFPSPDTDTDSDGLPDYVETGTGIYIGPANTGTDPGVQDTDGDGLSDGDEVSLHNTNPTLRDSDGDGFGDGVEINAGTNPNNSAGPWPAADGDIAVPYDGYVNAADVVVAAQMALGLRLQDSLALAHGDLASGGASASLIDVADLFLITRKALSEP